MSTLLDLNDAGLTIWQGGDAHLSPGYVHHDGERYNYGLGARAVARRFPRHISTRYWSQLNLQPLAPPLGPARHAADLVHGHLSQLLDGVSGDVMLAVPGHLSRDQLSLLLGVMETLPGDVTALVHRSAAIAAFSTDSDCVHVEYQLQQSILTPLVITDGQCQAGETIALPGKGWLWFAERVASIIASQFVEQTRFDPQRRAESEQSLYDAIPGLIRELATHTESRVEIEGYAARIRAEHLATVGSAYSQEIARSAPADLPWLVPPGMASLPGFSAGSAGIIEPAANWARRMQDQHASLRQPAHSLRLQRQLPVSQMEVTADPVAVSAPPAPAPTHYLTGHTARPLMDGISPGQDLVFGVAEGVVTIASTGASALRVNDQPLQPGQVLAAGDEISDDTGPVARMIIVED